MSRADVLRAEIKSYRLKYDLDELRRDLARGDFLQFVRYTKPDYITGWFHQVLAKAQQRFMQRVERCESPRQMLWVPAQHGKSEQVSRRFPPWVFGHHPNWHIISASYNSKLARRFGRDVRDIMSSARYRNIFPETIIGGRVEGNAGSKAADELSLTKGGSYLAVGLGGTAVGLPANIFNIDDPVKGAEEADSEVKQEGALDWYLGTAATRLQKGGGVLITQTRWGDDDLSGQLVEIMERDEKAEQWEIIVFPAIATEDEEHRKAGEALCPELHPLHELERTRATFIAAGRARDWSSIYQQNPTPADGVFYKAADFRSVRRAPKVVNTYITTDLALGQKSGNDWTVLLPGGVDPSDSLYILPQAMRKRMDALETACRLLLMANEINAQLITLPNDHMGKTLKPFLEKLMDGAEGDDAVMLGETEFEIPRRYYTIEMMPVIGDKVARSAAIQARQRQGKVFWTEGVFFNEVARPEMLKFPHGGNDDVCDAFADMGRLLELMDRARKPKAKKRTFTPPKRWEEIEERSASTVRPIPSLFGDEE